MASEDNERLDATWALIQRTRREIAQLRAEIEDARNTVDYSQRLLSGSQPAAE
jgi:hypothetical protein